jgi:hypothetical protein
VLAASSKRRQRVGGKLSAAMANGGIRRNGGIKQATASGAHRQLNGGMAR